jgi:hypothetical protein
MLILENHNKNLSKPIIGFDKFFVYTENSKISVADINFNNDSYSIVEDGGSAPSSPPQGMATLDSMQSSYLFPPVYNNNIKKRRHLTDDEFNMIHQKSLMSELNK